MKTQTKQAFIWSGIEGGLRPLIQFVFTIVIARILLPADFGLIAMISVLIGISDVFFDGGFGAALIQKQDSNDIEYNTVFLFNVVAGIVIYSVVFVASPVIAKFYNEPTLVNITRIYAVIILIRAFTSMQATVIVRKMEYKKLAFINTIAISVASAIGILFASLGYGVWALVIHGLILNAISAFLVWRTSDWNPSGKFDIVSIRPLFSFGSKIFFASLLEVLTKHTFNIIIGKKFHAIQLGFYDRAARIQQLTVDFAETSLHRVLFPVFSRKQGDQQDLANSYYRSFSMISFIGFPIVIVISLKSDELVRLLFGLRWIESVPYLRLLIISALFYPFITLGNALIKSTGKAKLYLNLALITKLILAFSIIIGWNWGIIGLILAQVISALFSFIVITYYSVKIIDKSIFFVMRVTFIHLLISFSVVSLMSLVVSYITSSAFLGLFLTLISSISLYVVIMSILGFESIKILRELVRIKFR